MIQRLALAAVAVVVAAWLVIGLRDARVHGEAREIVRESFRGFAASGRLGDDEPALRRAGRLLDDAELLNPDSSILYDRAIQLFLLGHPRESIDRLETLVEREPENSEAWATLAAISREAQPRLSARALDELRQLDPHRVERRR